MENKFMATVIRRIVKEFGLTPKQINEGECEEFAEKVRHIIPEAKIEEIQDHFEDIVMRHFYLKYKSKYYDSETPKGVAHWSDLPVYQRGKRSNNNLPIRGN